MQLVLLHRVAYAAAAAAQDCCAPAAAIVWRRCVCCCTRGMLLIRRNLLGVVSGVELWHSLATLLLTLCFCCLLSGWWLPR